MVHELKVAGCDVATRDYTRPRAGRPAGDEPWPVGTRLAAMLYRGLCMR